MIVVKGLKVVVAGDALSCVCNIEDRLSKGSEKNVTV